ncbi:MAG: hypothetical protein U1E52_02965 [Geminicoccaceae bacterium]
MTLNDATIASCEAGSGWGGGIYAESGSRVAVIASTLSDNGTDNGQIYDGSGGAIATNGDVALVIRNSRLEGNHSYVSGAISMRGGHLSIEGSTLAGNYGWGEDYGLGGAIEINNTIANISRTSIIGNWANDDGGISAHGGYLFIDDSTIANNVAGEAGGIHATGPLVIRNSTITGNWAYYSYGSGGGGITASNIDIANSIVAGNNAPSGSDIFGTIVHSDGHNLFGSDVAGNVSGDREGIAASAVFAAINPDTGGGLVNGDGVVLLLNSLANPALSGADPLAASATGQLGTTGRPLPAGSLPDIGSVEINHALSTTASANNDLLTGTAARNAINGLTGNDYLKGLGGSDTLHGNDGGDLLDGGAGNDKLYGDAGIDLVFYGGATKVTVDLSLAADKATRGSEVDALYNVEGAIGSSAADIFKGNEYNNYFQGGGGKDTATGGAGRDLYDFNAVADSKAGASTRDVITDFAHLTDKIDVMGLDADGTVAGNQAFHWVGTAALTGPGEIGYFTSGGNTIIRASTDADAASELEIQLTGIRTLSAVDFYL